ncbi:MAG: hypothetical protein ABJG42_24290 [Vibrio splendidus]
MNSGNYQLHVKSQTPHEVIQDAIREGGIRRTKAIIKMLKDEEVQDLKEAIEALWPKISKRLEEKNSARAKAVHWLGVIQDEFGVTRRGAIELMHEMAEKNKPAKRKYTKRTKVVE